MKGKLLRMFVTAVVCGTIATTGLHNIKAQEVQNVPVEVSVNSVFTVRLPVEISLSKKDNGYSYKGQVGVKGDLIAGAAVSVDTDNTFTMCDVTMRTTHDVPSSVEDQNYQHKEEKTVSITQSKTCFLQTDINQDTYTDADITLTTGKLEAGIWKGNLLFNIAYNEYGAIDVYHDNVADMIQDNTLTTGMQVKTRGFNVIDDGGSATYEIVDAAVNDDVTIFRLDNGKYAKLRYNRNTILNVASAGIFPGENMGNRFCSLLEYVGDGIEGIKFNTGEYYLDRQVYLKSLSYYGSDNTIIKIADNFQDSVNRIFLTSVIGDDLFNVNFYNLKFDIEVSDNFSLKDNRIMLMSLRNINSCTIDGCSFKARKAEENGVFTVVDLLWFQHSDTVQNVVIKDTNFECLMGEDYLGSNADYIQSGCLWFNGNNQMSSKLKDVSITNCSFTNTVSDETLAVWNFDADNLLIDNCTFNNHSHDSNNIFNLYDSRVVNSQMSNCAFNIQTPAQFACKIMSVNRNSDFKYLNCDFNFSYSGEMEQSEAQGIFYFFDEVDDTTGTNVVIDDCTFTTSGDKSYGTLVCGNKIKSKKISMENCQVDMLLKDAVFELMNASNIDLHCNSTNINTASRNLIELTSALNTELVVDNNNIEKAVRTQMNQYATVNYTFTNNHCSSSDAINLLFANWLDPSYGKSNLTVEGNTFSNAPSVNYFINNKASVDDSDLITMSIGDNIISSGN